MIAKLCDRESRRDTWFENRLVWQVVMILEFRAQVSLFSLEVVARTRLKLGGWVELGPTYIF